MRYVIFRDQKDRQKQAVVDKGKHAVTHFQVIEQFGDYTLVECRLETGRTHQIRVHMNYIGYPLVGDPKYGPKKTLDFGGQVLHAGDGFISQHFFGNVVVQVFHLLVVEWLQGAGHTVFAICAWDNWIFCVMCGYALQQFILFFL